MVTDELEPYHCVCTECGVHCSHQALCTIRQQLRHPHALICRFLVFVFLWLTRIFTVGSRNPAVSSERVVRLLPPSRDPVRSTVHRDHEHKSLHYKIHELCQVSC